ncbi:hypothetical protein [Nocardioides zeae]|uniref:Uncharacterized protein n=1 Tax=Nocardioides zeae TaxID=1457234 RepID=A0A6P0HDZ5_9ACTN|nr:hypothetical protein [Nocardioides zeae]NEN77009.1 hypothetical protein [Nocardioides zeae]
MAEVRVDGAAGGDTPLPRVRDLARDALGRMAFSVVLSAALVAVLALLTAGLQP